MGQDLPVELKTAFQRVQDALAKVQEARENAKTCAQLLRLSGSPEELRERADNCSWAHARWEVASHDYEAANAELLRLLGLSATL